MKIQTVGSNIIHLNNVSSTNNYAAELLNQTNVPNGTLIVTESQEKGKGQRGQSWDSEPGKNLMFSLILKNSFPHARSFQLSMMTALSIYELMDAYQFDQLHVKWPNDIYCHQKKVGGILIETSVQSSKVSSAIVGIGININQKSFSYPHAASFFQLSGREWDKSKVLERLIQILNKNYMLFLQNHDFKEAYIKHSLWWKEKRTFRSKESGEFTGSIVDYTQSGNVVIQNEKGVSKHYDLKEVQFII